MRVNIVYEINNREFYNCLLLQRELVRRGYDARIYNKTEDIVLSNEKSITVIPNSYRKEDVDHYEYMFNARNNLVIVYPCEQVNNKHLPDFFDYSESNPIKKMPHLCWGKYYYRFIESLGFDMTYSRITGAIQLDFCRKEFRSLFYDKCALSKRFGLPIEKKWILFISDFVHSSKMMTERLIISGDEKESVLIEKQKFEKKSCKEILSWFERFLNENEDYIIIYRKHPMEMVTDEVLEMVEKYKKRLYSISDLSIKEWIFNCDHIATWYSTAVVECIVAKRKLMLLRPYDFTKESNMIDYPFYIGYHKIQSYEAFEDSILNGEHEYQQNTIDVIYDLYSIEDKPAFQRVSDAIEEIASKWKAQKSDRWFWCKKWIYYFKRQVFLKIIIKKAYQFLHINIGVDFSKESDTKYTVTEWTASADNKEKAKTLGGQIDEIININFPIR